MQEEVANKLWMFLILYASLKLWNEIVNREPFSLLYYVGCRYTWT